jgi:glycosyltransferase involved in cell wall biosynthesis
MVRERTKKSIRQPAKKIESTLVILTRNEITGVKSVIKKIPFSAVDEYFAVDFRSTDGTVEFFEKQKIPVIKQTKPGRAEAFKIAVKNAKGSYIIFFSPDGNEDPKDIPALISELKNGADLIIASRFMKASRNEEDDLVLKPRKWANMAFTLAANILFRKNGKYITDSINGYRGIRKDLFNKLKLDAQGFAIEYQMTIRSLKHRAKIVEIPTTEGNRIGGKSGSKAIPTGIRFVYYLLKEI